MTPAQKISISEFVMRQLPEKFVRDQLAEDFKEYRIRVFPWALTIWLMMLQRLGSGESLVKAVDRLREGDCDRFLEHVGASKLVRSGRISNATGGYSQARQRVPLTVIEGAADHLNRCIEALHKEMTWHGRNVYLIDGSTLTLPHSKALIETYPPNRNQYGESHWPKMRTCYVHNLITGVSHRPSYGACYGDEASSEVGLFLSMLERVPERSVLVGDRLFGSFRVVYETTRLGHDVVVRLANDRARPFLNGMKAPGEMAVLNWQTKKNNRKTRLKDLPEDAAISGRFIWHRLKRKGYRPIELYIFTTLTESIEDIVELYGLRWNIETDIRSLKSCLNLDQISSKTPDMVHKEIILGHTAYNLVRHIAAIVAGYARIDPRRLSFQRVLNFVTIAGPRMVHLSVREQEAIIDRFADGAHQIINPKRKRPPQPRKLLPKRKKYPPLRKTRSQEHKWLMQKIKSAN